VLGECKWQGLGEFQFGEVVTIIAIWRIASPVPPSASRAMKTGRADREARISFATPELLWRVLTPKRWELLKVL
jgi:predicted transcriptional regulator